MIFFCSFPSDSTRDIDDCLSGFKQQILRESTNVRRKMQEIGEKIDSLVKLYNVVYKISVVIFRLDLVSTSSMTQIFAFTHLGRASADKTRWMFSSSSDLLSKEQKKKTINIQLSHFCYIVCVLTCAESASTHMFSIFFRNHALAVG